MKRFAMLWRDDVGVVAAEYLLVGSIVVLGLVVGLSNLEAALNAELTELGNGFLGLSQAYTINPQFGCTAARAGSIVFDTPQTVRFTFTGPPIVTTSARFVDIALCP